MLLSVAIEAFILSACAGKRNDTPSGYRKKLNKMVAVLGDVEIESITPSDLESYRQYLLTQPVKRRGGQGNSWEDAPLSVWYIRGVLRMCRMLFKWLMDNDYLPVNPAVKVKLPKKPQMLPKAIDQSTFEKLLQAARQTGDTWARARNVCFLCLLRDTGARLSGILGITLADIDLAGGTIEITEKGKTRQVFFNGGSKIALVQWLQVRQTFDLESTLLFVGKSGVGLSRVGGGKIIKRLAHVAGVESERCNPHSFRHAFARDTLRAGANLSQTSQLMGHSEIGVTSEYYARWLPSELKAVHQRVSPGAKIDKLAVDLQAAIDAIKQGVGNVPRGL